MKLIIDIPELDYECAKQRWMSGNSVHKMDYCISKGTLLDEMTNGEVIQTLYPNVSKYNNMLLENHSRNILFNDDWWNAPYQKGGEK